VTAGPYSFHLHLVAWVAVAAVGLAYGAAVRRAAATSRPGATPTRRQRWFLAGGLLALAAALTWPVADLAAHWSLTALLVQRLLLILGAAPLLLLALPAPVIAALTRPAPVDRALEVLTRPLIAVIVFTVIAVGTLLTPVVAAQGSSAVVRGAIDGVLLVGGAVLWGPVLRHIPGASRPSPVGLAAYLFVQSIVPFFPSVIYVFARHPLYPAFAHAHLAIGLSPLGDQELAGVMAKVATLPLLWSVAWVALARAAREDAAGSDAGVLTWAEVERQLERAERQERRPPSHRHPGRFPRPRVGFPPATNGPDAGPSPPASDVPGSPPDS
jgi:putative membrane protein